MTRAEQIVEKLRAGLAAEHVELLDESAKHARHPGARSGAGHFAVVVVSGRFEGLGRVARHRAVYEALGEMMGGEIHALSATTYTPSEWAVARSQP